MRLDIVHAREHRPDEYADTWSGYRALRLIDETGTHRGELVWRLAHGQSVEITELGIYDVQDRRQGLGTRLLDAAIADVRAFFVGKPYRLRRVYLFCDSTNDAGRRFYEARGFRQEAVLAEFYHYCDAVLYVRDMTDEQTGGAARMPA